MLGLKGTLLAMMASSFLNLRPMEAGRSAKTGMSFSNVMLMIDDLSEFFFETRILGKRVVATFQIVLEQQQGRLYVEGFGFAGNDVVKSEDGYPYIVVEMQVFSE